MPNYRCLLIAVTFCWLAAGARGQSAGWKPLKYGRVSLTYPPTWHVNREKRGESTRVTLTPDSMQQLGMRMLAIYELPVTEEHDYAFFKKSFTGMIRAGTGEDTKFLKTEETTFKGHKSMYAEVIQSSLPTKVYGIDAGSVIYMVVLQQRRYSMVADPGLERDGNAILNSIAISTGQ